MPAKMAGKLDTSLDDINNEYRRSGRKNEHSSSNSRGEGRSSYSGVGPHRRFRFHNAVCSPYSMQQVQILKPTLPETISANVPSDPEAGTKLYVSNLDYGVSDYDLEILFSEVGDLRRHSIHYDKSGRSKGTAEVVFVRQSDAIEAIKRYDNSMLDGKPVSINFVGMDLISPAFTPLPPISNSILAKPPSDFISGRETAFGHEVRSETGRELAMRYARQDELCKKVYATAEDLDAELEQYRLQAMQMNGTYLTTHS